ncbi:MAG: formyltransferase family protein [Hyphomicrobiaceae bacterium]
MRIALFNLDSVASNASTKAFIERFHDDIVFVGLSPPFRPKRGGLWSQARSHLLRSGLRFVVFLDINFVLPRLAAVLAPARFTLTGLCRRYRIPVEPVHDVNDPAFIRRLAGMKIDLVVSSFFDQIFKPEFIAMPRLGIVNVHIAPLTDHRGPMPVIFGCLADPPVFGVSLHYVESGIDTGPLLATEHFQLRHTASVLTMMRELQTRGMEALAGLLPEIEAGRVRPIPQAGGAYQGFPAQTDISALYSRGYRLYDWSDVAWSIKSPAKI